jgi:hypothetical protein
MVVSRSGLAGGDGPGAVECARQAARCRVHAQLGLAQFLPADQHQKLSVRLPQPRQRLEERASLLWLVGWKPLAKLVSQPVREAVAAARAAVLVGKDVTSSPVEPETCLVVEGYLAEAPPGNQERLGDDVGRVIGIRAAAQRIAEQVPRVVAV